MFQAVDRMDALPLINNLNGIVAKCRDEQDAPLAVPSVMIHAPIDAGESDAAAQRQGWRFHKIFE